MNIIDFFRETLSGWLYFLNVLLCILFILSLIGVLGEKKKKKLMAQFYARRMKEKEEGLDMKRAALEGKQIISVNVPTNQNVEKTPINPINQANIEQPLVSSDEILKTDASSLQQNTVQEKEEIPQVLVIDSNEINK